MTHLLLSASGGPEYLKFGTWRDPAGAPIVNLERSQQFMEDWHGAPRSPEALRLAPKILTMSRLFEDNREKDPLVAKTCDIMRSSGYGATQKWEVAWYGLRPCRLGRVPAGPEHAWTDRAGPRKA